MGIEVVEVEVGFVDVVVGAVVGESGEALHVESVVEVERSEHEVSDVGLGRPEGPVEDALTTQADEHPAEGRRRCDELFRRDRDVALQRTETVGDGGIREQHGRGAERVGGRDRRTGPIGLADHDRPRAAATTVEAGGELAQGGEVEVV